MDKPNYRFHSLEDFVASSMLTVDGTLDDGWGADIAVKGREINATILFCDISGFSRRTMDLSPTETLIFVNHFFTWMTAEAFSKSKGIIDKYIGDEVMIVFSKEFGCEHPFEEAVQVASGLYRYDAFSFAPHVGIASGRVIVGHVGTAIRYNCSVFGRPVVIAARCASVQPDDNRPYSGGVTFPADEWGARELVKVLPPGKRKYSDGTVHDDIQMFELLEPRTVKVKNLPDLEIRELRNMGMHLPQLTAEDWARDASALLKKNNRQWM